MKGFWFSILVLLFLVGCSSSGVHDEVLNVAEMVRSGNPELYQRGIELADSVLSTRPKVRTWDDSLAHRDSSDISYLHLVKLGYIYHTRKDTVASVFAFMDAMPWLSVANQQVYTDHAIRFAGTIGHALSTTESPRMAALSRVAFGRAIDHAIALEDSVLVARLMSSYNTVVALMITMPDSVKEGFRYPESHDENAYWPLFMIALALTFVVAGWAVIRKEKRTSDRDLQGTTHQWRVLAAVYDVCYREVSHVHVRAVRPHVRSINDQGAILMLAALALLGGEESDLERQRQRLYAVLKRHFKSNGWGALPTKRHKWRAWFAQRGWDTHPPKDLTSQ